MPNSVKVTIDGQQVEVPANTLIVEAARRVGIDIPVFCYHPKLDPVGMCRMCLVEVGTPKMDPATRKPVLDEQGNPVIAMMPKPQTACTMPVSPGMVVKTATNVVADARKSVLEFLLTSHPLDCPVCDKGGECPLQELTFSYGPGVSRMPLANKFHFVKPIPLGDLIMLDRERCIQCARCIRFEDEIADDHVLEFKHRGRQMEIVTMSDPPFDSKWSGNTTDICPVGALTSRDFRFKARPWELDNTTSICPHCSVGCNIMLSTRYDDIKRVMPREHDTVNEIWICDKGRYGHHYANAKDRVTTPLIRRGDQFVAATWDEALGVVAERLNTLKATHGPDALGGLSGDRVSNEDLYLFQKLLRGVIGTNNVDHATRSLMPANTADLVSQVGVASGSNMLNMGKGSAILVIGGDPDEEQPVIWLRVKQAAAKRGASLIVANPRPTKLDRYTRAPLRYRFGASDHVALGLLAALWELKDAGEDLVLEAEMLADLRKAAGDYSVARAAEASGVTADALRDAARTFAKAADAVVLFGPDLGDAGAQALANLLLVTRHVGNPDNGLIALLPHNNSHGALDMGVRPDRLPGHRSLLQSDAFQEAWGARLPVKAGLSAGAMLQGRVRGLYVLGTDPAADDPASVDALSGLEFLVVEDLFMTPTAQLAHVVLPATSWAERDGTFTSTDRRIQRFSAAIRRLGQARPDWEILSEVAQRLRAHDDVPERDGAASAMARDWTYLAADHIMAEIEALVPLYQGISQTQPEIAASRGRVPFESFIQEGTRYALYAAPDVQWPVTAESGGNPRPQWLASNAQPLRAASGQLLLAPVRRLFDAGTMIGKATILAHRLSGPYAVMHPADAASAGLTAGTRVTLATRGGSAEFDLRVSEDAPQGVVLAAENMGVRLRGGLLDAAGTPAVVTLAPVPEMALGD